MVARCAGLAALGLAITACSLDTRVWSLDGGPVALPADAGGIRDARRPRDADSRVDAGATGDAGPVDRDASWRPDARVDRDAGPCSATSERCEGTDEDCDGIVDEAPADCGPCVRRAHGGRSYLYCDSPLSWDLARTDCWGRGAYDLLVVDDPAEDAAVWSIASARVPGSDWWMGLEDMAVPGTYVWVTGRVVWDRGAALGYTNWRDGVPQDTPGQACCELDLLAGQWADNGCDVSLPYVCEQTGP